MTARERTRPARAAGRSRGEFAVALVAQLVGAGAVLLLATRAWQTVRVARPAPFSAYVFEVNGRTVDAAPTAFALVALAGVVAVLATKGVARRGIGALVALAGVALVWRSATALGALSAGRARSLARDRNPRAIESDTVVPHVSTHPVWGVLSIAAAVLVVLAGAAIAARGARWAAMSARYEAPHAADPADAEQARARADASMWTALERGDDPTALDPRESD